MLALLVSPWLLPGHHDLGSLHDLKADQHTATAASTIPIIFIRSCLVEVSSPSTFSATLLRRASPQSCPNFPPNGPLPSILFLLTLSHSLCSGIHRMEFSSISENSTSECRAIVLRRSLTIYISEGFRSQENLFSMRQLFCSQLTPFQICCLRKAFHCATAQPSENTDLTQC